MPAVPVCMCLPFLPLRLESSSLLATSNLLAVLTVNLLCAPVLPLPKPDWMPATASEPWLLFDDTRVDAYDDRNLQEDCFGGKKDSSGAEGEGEGGVIDIIMGRGRQQRFKSTCCNILKVRIDADWIAPFSSNH